MKKGGPGFLHPENFEIKVLSGAFPGTNRDELIFYFIVIFLSKPWSEVSNQHQSMH